MGHVDRGTGRQRGRHMVAHLLSCRVRYAASLPLDDPNRQIHPMAEGTLLFTTGGLTWSKTTRMLQCWQGWGLQAMALTKLRINI